MLKKKKEKKNPRGEKELNSYETSVQGTENKGEHGTWERRSDEKH